MALAPDPILQDLFKAPVVETSWKRRNVEPELVRFGLLWKVYDMVGSRGLNYHQGILGDLEIRFDRWILGGYSGTDFLMAPVDLVSLPVSRKRETTGT